jgi:hypothetical protein
MSAPQNCLSTPGSLASWNAICTSTSMSVLLSVYCVGDTS